MAFDTATYTSSSPTPSAPVSGLIDTVGDLCPIWAVENPDRALALLFVAPRACVAVDALVAL